MSSRDDLDPKKCSTSPLSSRRQPDQKFAGTRPEEDEKEQGKLIAAAVFFSSHCPALHLIL